jgi:hypothetical protein
VEQKNNVFENEDLFSRHFLEERIQKLPEWECDEEAREAFNQIKAIYDGNEEFLKKCNEKNLRKEFINKVLDIIGFQDSYSVDDTITETGKEPDYAFFETEEKKKEAKIDDRLFEECKIVGDAKQWDINFDKDKKGEPIFDNKNPSFQVYYYLGATEADWAILTKGWKWRIYFSKERKLDVYYEVNLKDILEDGYSEDFKYFYLFFRKRSFFEDAGKKPFLERVYEQSSEFSQALEDSLEDRVYEALKYTIEGFYDANDLSEDDLERVHSNSMVLLYRLIFVLYAESRDLLPLHSSPLYRKKYSLSFRVGQLRDEDENVFVEDFVWNRCNRLFKSISEGKEIEKKDFRIPAYNGRLFDEEENPFLENNVIEGQYIEKILESLAIGRDHKGNRVILDYKDLDIRHLGSIYEGLLEYQPKVAEEKRVVVDGKWEKLSETDKDFDEVENENRADEGEVYLSTDDGERKATGSYYTPDYVVEYIVENTVGPKIEEKIEEAEKGDKEVLSKIRELNVCDPAMGSGHFLTEATHYIGQKIIEEVNLADKEIQADNELNWAKREAVQNCIYGVDVNPLATELAKLSLWLETMSEGKPLSFLDHHLKVGNSLIGSKFSEVEQHPEANDEEAQNSFTEVNISEIKQDLKQKYLELEEMPEEEKVQIEAKEAAYEKLRENHYTYKNLRELFNIHTYQHFDSNISATRYDNVSKKVTEPSWTSYRNKQWFKDAQADKKERRYFHWELEFPKVFFGNSSGFDAVVGNPPYVRVQRLGYDQADYIFDQYETCSNKVDLSVPFLEKSIELIAEDGISSYISTYQWISTDYGESVREFMSDGKIERMIDFNTLPVFEGVDTYPAIFILTKEKNENLRYAEINEEEDLNLDSLQNLEFGNIDYNNLTSEPWVLAEIDLRSIIDRSETVQLSDLGSVLYGTTTGMDSVFIVSEEKAEEENLEKDLLYPFAYRGEEINKFAKVEPKAQIIYPYEDDGEGGSNLIPPEKMKENYPNTYSYLEKHKERLSNRKDSREYYAKGDDWYCLVRPARYEYISKEKLLFKGVAKESTVGILYGDSLFSGANCPGFITKEDEDRSSFLLAILNSDLISTYLTQVCPSKLQGYTRFNSNNLNKIPVKQISDDDFDEENLEELKQSYYEHLEGKTAFSEISQKLNNYISDNEKLAERFLSDVVEEIISFKKSYDFNLDISEYTNNYEEGKSIGDMYHPVDNVTDTILGQKTSDKEGLKFGSIQIEDKSDKVILYTSARYKPDNPENFETDSHGYTETDLIPTFYFKDLNKTEKILIQEFLPYAFRNEENDFKKDAAKTISLLERLKNLKMPKVADVKSDVARFQEIRDEAKVLQEKIKKTDKTINEAVFNLYNLSEEEKNKIRS